MNDLLQFQLTDPDFADGAPAADWARVLEAFQRLTHALALGLSPGLRPNAEFRRRHELRAHYAEGGAMALALAPRQLALELGLGLAPSELQREMATLLSRVAALDAAGVGSIAPEPASRRRLLRDLQKLLPKGPERWTLGVTFAHRAPIELGCAAARWIEGELAASNPAGPLMMTVTGELVGVDFAKGTLAFRYAPTGRVIEGLYAAEEEVGLLKSRRKLIHVTGEFVLDAEDHPIRLKRMTAVAVADLSPITLETVKVDDGRAFALVPPLRLVPTMDADTQQLYEVQDDALDLYLTAPSRDELEAALLRHAKEAAGAQNRAWKRRCQPMLAAAD